MPTLARSALILLFAFAPTGAFSLAPAPNQESETHFPVTDADIRRQELEAIGRDNKRQQDQALDNHDLFQCRYLLGLLDQDWSRTYSDNARPSKDTIKRLRKEARSTEKAVRRLIVDLGGAKPLARSDESKSFGNVPSDFISTLHRVIAELNTFARLSITDADQQQTLVTDLRLLGTLLGRF